MTPLTPEQKKRQNLIIVGTALSAGLVAFLITALVLNNKYARLEAKYWGM